MLERKNYILVLLILVIGGLAIVFSCADYLKVPHFPQKPFKLGLDLQGGVHLVYQADLSKISDRDKAEVMSGLRDVIERRVNVFGVREPLVQVQGERLIVELSGDIDPAEAIKEIGKTPVLEFREQKENFEEIEKKNQQILERIKEAEEKGENVDELKAQIEEPFKSTGLDGRYLKKARLDFDQNTSEPFVSLEFNNQGAKIFEELTAKNVGKILAIYIDGIPISTPRVQEKISGGRARITGHFTVKEAKELARNLSAGALPAPIHLISQNSVGPSLGKISLQKSLKAGVFGLLGVILFMILFYRLPGLIASVALIIYTGIILSLFKLIPVTLTLAGIGGFILSVGMAVDANVLIFERLREELRQGKDFSFALKEAFRRAWPSIRDGNLTTLIVAIILFEFGTSFVKGFALTLGLGILVSMFSAVVITRSFLNVFLGTKLEKARLPWKG